MATNKVVVNNQTLIDLTGDTVTPGTLGYGVTAHGADGEAITGANTYDADTQDATASADDILSSKTAYARGAKLTGSMTNRGSVSGTISTKAGSYTIQKGFHSGSGSVSISSTEQAKIIAGNIKNGVSILGVAGTYKGVDTSGDTVTAATLLKGITAHNSAGSAITGTMEHILYNGNFYTKGSSSYAATNLTLTIQISGVYDVSWYGIELFSGGFYDDYGSALYKNGSIYGSGYTSFDSYGMQFVQVTNVSLNAGDILSIYVKTPGTRYYVGVGFLACIMK